MDAHNLTFDYYTLLCSNRLLPTITKPTRITDHTATLIDNIFINLMNRSTATILYNGLSDHFPILLEIATNSNCKAKYDHTTRFETKRFFTHKPLSFLLICYQHMVGVILSHIIKLK